MTAVGLLRKPQFLLVDVAATVASGREFYECEGYGFLVLYVLAPEKFVLTALVYAGTYGDWRWKTPMILLYMFDLCGIGALASGVASPEHLPMALGIGYTATAIGAIAANVCQAEALLRHHKYLALLAHIVGWATTFAAPIGVAVGWPWVGCVLLLAGGMLGIVCGFAGNSSDDKRKKYNQVETGSIGLRSTLERYPGTKR
jgi:hypothetical protein